MAIKTITEQSAVHSVMYNTLTSANSQNHDSQTASSYDCKKTVTTTNFI